MKKKSNTLHLVVTNKWYQQIVAGTKTEEYRQVKKHWISRLTWHGGKYKAFKYIKFVNGHQKNAPFAIAEFKYILLKEITHEHFGPSPVAVFAIGIGEVLGHQVAV